MAENNRKVMIDKEKHMSGMSLIRNLAILFVLGTSIHAGASDVNWSDGDVQRCNALMAANSDEKIAENLPKEYDSVITMLQYLKWENREGRIGNDKKFQWVKIICRLSEMRSLYERPIDKCCVLSGLDDKDEKDQEDSD